MEKNCKVGECIWSDQDRFCDVLENASIPLDKKWPLMVLYLRGIQNTHFLSEVQKAGMQEALLQILGGKDFSDKRYYELQQRIFAILTAKLSEKISAITRETSALAKDMDTLFGKRRRELAAVASTVDESLERGEDPAGVLAGLRDALKDVVAQMERDACTLTSLSQKDGLTGLANRRSFDAFLDESVRIWLEKGVPCSLLLLDVDHFKKFNDTYGHLLGDQVLRTLAQQIQKTVAHLSGGSSLVHVARYGGEEFVVLLRGRVASRAAALAESIRKAVQHSCLLLRDAEDNVVQSGIRVTVSIGVSRLWSGWSGAYQTNLVDFADKALYRAKNQGRNCAVQHVPEGEDHFALIVPEQR